MYRSNGIFLFSPYSFCFVHCEAVCYITSRCLNIINETFTFFYLNVVKKTGSLCRINNNDFVLTQPEFSPVHASMITEMQAECFPSYMRIFSSHRYEVSSFETLRVSPALGIYSIWNNFK